MSNADGEEEFECYFNFLIVVDVVEVVLLKMIVGFVKELLFWRVSRRCVGCNGETFDECGVCDNDEANDCEHDCLGVWGGDAQIDDCGVCNGGNLDKDCNGICFGDAYLDDCGVCDNIEDNNNISCTGCTTLGACNFDLTALQCEDCCLFFDCAGECGGDAFIGNCSTCIGGQTGLQEVDFNFDLDNLCNDIDDCPYDAENDVDQDGICGDVDDCPYDAENDADQDGYMWRCR